MSKLDQMRDQFRERLNLRPVSQTKIHVIKVESNDNNNNNLDLKASRSETYCSKNSIPTLRKNVPQIRLSDNQKSINSSKVNANKFNTTNQFSVYHKNQNSTKKDSNNSRKKIDSNPELGKRSPYKWTKNSLLEDLSPNRVKERETPRGANTEGTACRYCQRHFALSDRLEKHESVCMSSLDKSRIKFNSFEQRVKGQPNDYLLIYENALKNESNKVPKKWNWRQKHQYCIAAIKTAKGETSSGPTPSQIMASIQEQCDYCKRRFNEEAIKRHLPICAKLFHKKLLKI